MAGLCRHRRSALHDPRTGEPVLAIWLGERPSLAPEARRAPVRATPRYGTLSAAFGSRDRAEFPRSRLLGVRATGYARRDPKDVGWQPSRPSVDLIRRYQGLQALQGI